MKRLAIAAVGIALVVASACGGEGLTGTPQATTRALEQPSPASVASGSRTYSRFGFSFRYPEDAELSEQEPAPAHDLGQVSWRAGQDLWGLTWVGAGADEIFSARGTVEAALQNAEQGMRSKGRGISRGGMLSLQVGGIDATLASYDIQGVADRGMVAAWYCEGTPGRGFIYARMGHRDFDPSEEVAGFLGGFKCADE